jgi:oligopeptide transport system ATP-binding protein
MSLVRLENIQKSFEMKKSFFSKSKQLEVLSAITLQIQPGETLGLVGESGCGKSTLGKLMIRLIEPTSGRVFFKGQDVSHLSSRLLRPLRKQMQMIFQAPGASLNPHMNVEALMCEPLNIHQPEASIEEKKEKISHLLSLCGLRSEILSRYPHQCSGGQKQRICIARALAVHPDFLVCDEPVSALDVSIQAQIINLMRSLQDTLGLTYLFISHNLRLVQYFSTRVVVMYLGRIVEQASVQQLYQNPRHPYTRALFAAMPSLSQRKKYLPLGEPASIFDLPSGCHFHPRCPMAQSRCQVEAPLLRKDSSGSEVACHYA